MSTKNANAKKIETAVETTAVVVDTVPNTNNVVDIQMAPKSKAALAQAIYEEEAAKGEDKLRARVIARFKAEVGMSDAGSSTYFQNCKKRANGEKVKHYYKPASERKAPKADETVDDSKEDAPIFEVELADGNVKCFLSQEEKDQFIADNAELIKQ